MLRGLKQSLCTQDPETPTEAKLELCSSVSCRGTGQKWPAAKAEALGSNRPGYGISLLGGGNPTTELPELIQDWETDSWRAQTETCVHQDPGERSSDPTRD